MCLTFVFLLLLRMNVGILVQITCQDADSAHSSVRITLCRPGSLRVQRWKIVAHLTRTDDGLVLWCNDVEEDAAA